MIGAFVQVNGDSVNAERQRRKNKALIAEVTDGK